MTVNKSRSRHQLSTTGFLLLNPCNRCQLLKQCEVCAASLQVFVLPVVKVYKDFLCSRDLAL